MDAAVRHSTLNGVDGLDGLYLFKENEGCSAQSDFAMEYFQTPHQRDDISGNTPWIRDVVRKGNHTAQLCRYCGGDSHVRSIFFKAIDIISKWQKRAAYRQIKKKSQSRSQSRILEKQQARTCRENC